MNRASRMFGAASLTGLGNDGGTVEITGSTFEGNSASATGGAVYNLGVLTVGNSTFFGNASTSRGGAIYDATIGLRKTRLLERCDLEHPVHRTWRGAVDSTAADRVYRDCLPNRRTA